MANEVDYCSCYDCEEERRERRQWARDVEREDE